MSLNSHTLLGLPVETRSGAPLGRVSGFTLDEASQSILSYEVKRGRILGDHLLVHRGQVLSLTEEKMVTEDAVVKEEARDTMRVKGAQPAAGSVASIVRRSEATKPLSH